MKFTYTKTALLLAACALAPATPVTAQDALPQIAVPYDDLDLTRAEDVRKLERRMVRNTRRLCESIDRVGSVSPRNKARCVRETLEDNRHLVALAVRQARAGPALATR